ncbi:hypothetical protein GCM10010339_85100 [Streptomyces alanosinicus]|uniref:PPM-type phosphatase domain-containing protein n=2 Tax=Streptomyces alanosinicus TaxID=68171 RepID=A0A918YRY0_9ACTN|nr:GAF domain-containing SpoIIE family protein phosphatase [Streptomyces alanosinicus]GHE14434.1 hypothetical protein GCM10010339_85100 [Streptomyces alanosinicus]
MDWPAQDPARAAWVREHQPHSFLVAPLRARGTNLGVAVFTRPARSAAPPFEPADLQIAVKLAGRAAVCIDNARRYTREHGIALALQQSLLPQRLPAQAAVEVAGRYLPAGSPSVAGGDRFDVIPLSGARVASVVGDVSGYGIHASATMGRLRMAVRTLADVDLAPDELLSHLEDLVIRLDADSGSRERIAGAYGVSCLYAIYDPVSRTCTLASADHPAPVLVTPEGTADLLGLPMGPPLGLGGGLPIECSAFEVPQGSFLALYTDGLVVDAHRDVTEGQDSLRTVLAAVVGPLESTGDTVLKTMLAERPADDVARLIARTQALDASQVAVLDLPADPAVVAAARSWASARSGPGTWTISASSPNWWSASWSPTPSGTAPRPADFG